MLLRHLVEQMTLLKIGQIISVDIFFFFKWVKLLFFFFNTTNVGVSDETFDFKKIVYINYCKT